MEKNIGQKTGVEEILKRAFWYWNKTLIYQFIYSLLFLSLFFLGYLYLFRHFGLWEEVSKYSDLIKTDLPGFNKKMEEIAQLPQARNVTLGVFVLLALIYPLNVGFYKIYRKIDLKEPITMNDLFAGYLGFDFFKFFGFYLFWIVVFTYTFALLIPGLIWIFITLFCVPLMFFMDIKTFQGINLTVKALRGNLTLVLVCMLVAALFSFSGILLIGIGFLFTFPFWNAIVYALYEQLYKEMD